MEASSLSYARTMLHWVTDMQGWKGSSLQALYQIDILGATINTPCLIQLTNPSRLSVTTTGLGVFSGLFIIILCLI